MISKIKQFEKINYHDVFIDCTSDIASIEAYVNIGMLSLAESFYFYEYNIMPYLKNSNYLIGNTNSSSYRSPGYYEYRSGYYSSSISKNLLPRQNLQGIHRHDPNQNMMKFDLDHKTCLFLSDSENTKQIVTSIGDIKIPQYDFLLDDFNNILEIKSNDTTTFDINITPHFG